MEGRDDLDRYFGKIKETLLNYQEDEFTKFFRSFYEAGSKVVYQKNISETKIFDMEWITTVESYFPSIDKITKNPRSFIKYEDDIVDVSRAKKTDAKTVRHLAANTQFIRDIDKDNNIIPKKVLISQSDVDYAIYENRFIATLINRLFLFVRNRYEIIKANVESFQKDHLNVDSSFKIAESEVKVKLDVVVKKDLDNKTINEHNNELLERVSKLNTLCTGLQGSQFMQLLKGTAPVRPPIMKTNVIMKDSDFKNAYMLWLFLDRYGSLGYDVSIKEKNLDFDDDFKDTLENLIFVNYVSVLGSQLERNELYNTDEGYKEYLKKKTKVATQNAEDFVENPDQIKIEDNTLNEYFLNKYKSLFDQSVVELEAEGKVTHEEAIKRALRKTTEIVNGLYENIFKFEEDNDVFRKLVDKEDIEKDYETKKNQLKYAKMITDIKEVDYNNAIRRERKLLKELEGINDIYIKQKKAEMANVPKKQSLIELEQQIEDLKNENKEYEKRIKELENLKKFKDEEKQYFDEAKKEAINKAGEELKAFSAELKVKEQEVLAQAKLDLINERAETKALKAREKQAIKDRNKAIDDKLNEDYKKIQEKLRSDKDKMLAGIEKKRLALIAKEEKIKANQEAKERRQRLLNEQKERERIAIMKVRMYEEKIRLQKELEKQKVSMEKEMQAKLKKGNK